MIAVGIDVAKKTLDVWMNNKLTKISNNELALKKLFDPIQRDGVRIIMEATGRYHRSAHRILSTLGFEVMVINPYQSRHFAKAMNILCKTDKVDAKVLSQYAQRMDFVKTPVASKTEESLQNLVRYLEDLKGVLIQYKQLLEGAEGIINTSLKRLIKLTEKEMVVITKKIEALIESDKQLKRRCEILCSVPGIGKTTAVALVALLKELGNVTNKEAAALAGLAPMNCDSGAFVGKRQIQKGRHDVRRLLYLPVVGAATQSNSVLKIFYNRLIAKGKPAKVALTACMRKLIVYANTLLRKDEQWNPKETVGSNASATAVVAA